MKKGTLAAADPVAADNRTHRWMVGTGVEWALIDNWSTKIEYDYLGFNSHNVTMAGFVPTGEGPHAISRTFNINQNISIIKIGLNYRFNWGAAPLVASY